MTDLATVLARHCATISRKVTASYPEGMDPELVMRRRVGKIFVEAGELGDAIEGYTGENPRKGKYGSAEEVIKELIDCASASLCAIEYMTGDKGQSVSMVASQVAGNLERLNARPTPERPTTWEEGECPIRVGWHHAAHHVTRDCVRSRSLDASTAEPPPVPKAPTIPVLINGTPYTGTLDPATGTLHVHTVPPITEPPADISWATFEDHRGRRTDYQGNPIPPITDDEGGRRGD